MIDTPAGTFSDCIVLAFESPGALDGDIAYAFAPNVGIVYMSGAWIDERLSFAVVKDDTFATSAEADMLDIEPGLEVTVYPSPSSEGVFIQVHEPTGVALVSVRIYDALGRQRLDLGATRRPAGVLYWDARDSAGSRVPAGVYYVVVTSGSNRMVRAAHVL